MDAQLGPMQMLSLKNANLVTPLAKRVKGQLNLIVYHALMDNF
jgi:hypothetical protein